MKQAQSTILAVGAAGKFAGLVLPALAQRGAKVRGLIRRASDAEEVRAHGATDVAVGDLGDRASVKAALDGIDSVFYIAPGPLRGLDHALTSAPVYLFVRHSSDPRRRARKSRRQGPCRAGD